MTMPSKASSVLKTTEKGKELRIRPIENKSGYEVYFYPGGQVPMALTGAFTSHSEALKAISLYSPTKRA